MDTDMGFIDFLKDIDTILYGRKSYELWGQYVPENEMSDTEKEIWKLVHSKKKYVFSKAPTNEYSGANLISCNIMEEVKKIKNDPGKEIWLYGGARLITTFLNLGLVDEYRLSIHPVILGEGKPLFSDIKQRLNLKLINTKKFSSGVVQRLYHTARN